MERDHTKRDGGQGRPGEGTKPEERDAGGTRKSTRERARDERGKELDEELEQTFPASDPVPPKHVD